MLGPLGPSSSIKNIERVEIMEKQRWDLWGFWRKLLKMLQAPPLPPLLRSYPFPLPTLSLWVQGHISHLSVTRPQGAIARPWQIGLESRNLGLDAIIGWDLSVDSIGEGMNMALRAASRVCMEMWGATGTDQGRMWLPNTCLLLYLTNRNPDSYRYHLEWKMHFPTCLSAKC